MAKLDGMDPKLVREMLAQVQHAAKQMDAIEARVTQLTRTAGLAVQVTHRPSQIADACSTMVKDVTARVALLEKKHDSGIGKAPSGKDSSGKDLSGKGLSGTGLSGKDSAADGDTTRPADTASKDAHPKDDEKPSADKSGDNKPKSDEAKPHDKGNDDKGQVDRSLGDGTSEDNPKGDAKADDAKPQDSGDSRSSGEKPDGGGGDGNPQDKSDGQPSGEKPEGAKGDEKQPAGKGDSPIYDTPKKDHPDDIDQTLGRQVIDVDGVKVVSTPMNQPSAEYRAWLNEHMDQIPPVDGPTVDAASGKITGHHPDGAPGHIAPNDPAAGAYDPPGDSVLTPADNATYDPVAVDAPHPAAAEHPSAESVLTPADNVTDDPAARAGAHPVTADPSAESVLTPADNVTEDPAAVDAPHPSGSHSAAASPATAPRPDDVHSAGSDVTSASGGGGGSGDVVSGSTADPRSLAAAQPGDVLSAPAGSFDERALGTLIDHHREIEPLDMPSVSVPSGEWGKGEWAPREIQPDGRPGNVDPGDPSGPIPPPGA